MMREGRREVGREIEVRESAHSTANAHALRSAIRAVCYQPPAVFAHSLDRAVDRGVREAAWRRNDGDGIFRSSLDSRETRFLP